MRILVFTHNYAPEGNALASRFSAMCSHWAAAGHDVQVITCTPNFPVGVVYEGYRNRFVQHEQIDGVDVVRVWTYVTPNKGTFKRMIHFLVYMVMAVLVSLFQKRPDVMIGSSPQFFCAWAGLLSSRLRWRRVPFVAEIRDLWPDSIVAVGAMKNKIALGFVYFLEKRLYRGATRIVTVGPGYFEDLKEKGVPDDKISIIPNGVDKALFSHAEPDGAFVERYGLDRKTSCAYIGTIGMAAGLDVLLEVAEHLREAGRNDILLLLIGEGAERETLQKKARERRLENLILTGMIPKTRVPGVLAAVDICLVHLKREPLFARVLPSKIFEMAAMQKPIVLGVEGFAARLIEEAGAGIPVTPGHAGEIGRAILELADDPQRRKTLGQSGAAYMLDRYDREKLAGEYLDVLRRMLPPER